MAEFRVASIDEIPEGGGLVVEVDGRRLALFRHGGEFFALDETCPHRGGPLHQGTVHEGVISCPWHLWQFNLRTGVSPVNPLSRVRIYPTRILGKDLFVELA